MVVYCTLNVITTPEAEVRNLPKLLWLLIVLFFPIVGGIAWLVTRQVVTPVRLARSIAERLAAGRLEERMQVRGDDDIDTLGSIQVPLDLLRLQVGRQHLSLELGHVGQRLGHAHDLLSQLSGRHEDNHLGPGHGGMGLLEGLSLEILVFLSLFLGLLSLPVGLDIRVLGLGDLERIDGGQQVRQSLARSRLGC